MAFLPDRKADRIVQILRDDVLALVGPPQRLHSDQGQNFESGILSDFVQPLESRKAIPPHTTRWGMDL